MKATVSYKDGWKLIIPTDGNAPMLFLEWMANFRAGENPIHKVMLSPTNPCVHIRLNINKEQIEECAEYINLNI